MSIAHQIGSTKVKSQPVIPQCDANSFDSEGYCYQNPMSPLMYPTSDDSRSILIAHASSWTAVAITLYLKYYYGYSA